MWNLCINALEAMSEGILTLSLREVFSFQSGEFKSDHGGMVLEFQDEGCGIAADQINNIYDPFYTSKKDGVGLGLSTETEGLWMLKVPLVRELCSRFFFQTKKV